MCQSNEIPPFLADAYKLISDEYTSLFHLFKQYRQLYGHSKERIELLNECAPSFFSTVEVCMFDSIHLGISKLLDPAKKQGNRSVTLEWLEVLITNKDPKRKELIKSLSALRSKMSAKAVNIKGNRDKRIAHADRSKARGQMFYPFGVSRKDVKDIMADMGRYLKLIELHYTSSDICFSITTEGEAEDLLHLLANGLLYDELRDKGGIDSPGESNNKWHRKIGESIQYRDDMVE